MKKRIYISTVAIILALFVIACSENGGFITDPLNSNETRVLQKKTYTPTMDDIDQIAQSLSLLLQNKKYRDLLENKINSSSFVEKILEVSTFLELKDDQGENILSALTKSISPDKKDEFARNMNALKFGLIDIYFPIVEHRNTWNAEKELIIAPLNSKMIEEDDSFIGYKIGGEQVEFSKEPDPNKPVLVVCPSEKSGNYTRKSQSMIPLMKSSQNYSTTSEGGGGTTQTYYRTQIKKMYIGDDYDAGLFGGEMEIYVKVDILYGGTWRGWTRHNMGNYTEGVWETENVVITNKTGAHSYTIKIYEEDDWLNGGDDYVAGSTYDFSYIGNSSSSINTLEGMAVGTVPWLSTNRYRLLIEDDVTNSSGDPDEHNIQLYHYKYYY